MISQIHNEASIHSRGLRGFLNLGRLSWKTEETNLSIALPDSGTPKSRVGIVTNGIVFSAVPDDCVEGHGARNEEEWKNALNAACKRVSCRSELLN